MAYWLFKEEPSHYSFQQLIKDGRTVWDGVSNNLALKHLRNSKKGDRAFFYHTGNETAIVGITQIVSNPYPDPKLKNPKMVVVDIMPEKPLKRPVTLSELKADPSLASFDLLRLPRLSVMPVPEKIWDIIVRLSER